MTDSNQYLETLVLKRQADYLAPDGFEIRVLPRMKSGSLCHCTLPAGQTSSPTAHQYVEKIWYVLEGEGEVWRKGEGAGVTVRVSTGTSLTIPPRMAFQFCNTGAGPLCILIVTMPPWPDAEEAEPASGVWAATVDAE